MQGEQHFCAARLQDRQPLIIVICKRSQTLTYGSRLGAFLVVSLEITRRTSDWEIPNCFAIFAGVTPALKAARTAFSLPMVNVTAGASISLLKTFLGVGGFLPRRCCSAITAASIAQALCRWGVWLQPADRLVEHDVPMKLHYRQSVDWVATKKVLEAMPSRTGQVSSV
jgi:hypothetical protein